MSFVTRSRNRVAVLEALTPDGCTRRDLGERTEISQAWIETDDDVIRSWANGWIDAYRDRTHSIDPDANDRPA